MARGNIVTIDSVRRMFGLIVLVAQSGNFKDYERIYLSKTGTIIGSWRKEKLLDAFCQMCRNNSDPFVRIELKTEPLFMERE